MKMSKMKRLINEPSGVCEMSLDYKSGRGWICQTNEGKTVFVIGDAVGYNAQKGDCFVAAIETHQNAPEPHYYAAWAIAKSESTNLVSVQTALALLTATDAIRGDELGIGNGDILYHAGLVAKFVKQDRRTQLDAGTDIWYSSQPDDCEVGAFEYD